MDHLQEIAEQFKLLGDRTRLAILALLKERDLCVCEMVDALNLSQPNVSQHLRKLKAGGLVHETRKGKWVYYSLNVEDKKHVKAVLEYLPSLKEKILSLPNRICE
ncbi:MULTISPECIES: ArsR/SmtB family transcription factor [Geobacillus]|uniref:ArsR family transcriptional regulator n=1 Tax=Geobacillus thermopakistaniensis (strain MAS1) TaxID=1408282 RepID=A0A7U9P5J4_GEOTM|nr:MULTISPECIES: metalloregulator ArsR/SmtB family transcription factor [Geobacillus]ESU71355.1 ArsR family transcriptional regulator [Geobacillus sp. MAS1]MBW7644710.1 metalloregulator ArsR/SmtB family transcription factor [Geobacillus thermoleovorans]